MSLKVSRILHAGYLFEHNTTQILFDPIFENPFSHNCYAYPNVKFDIESIRKLKPSAVFISHYHDDHCSFESLDLINRNTPIYIYCVHEEIFTLLKELGFKKVFSLDLNIPIQVDAFKIIPRAALDRDLDSMFHIQIEDLNILNVVDSWIDSDTLFLLSKFVPWDLVLWPFQTMKEIDVLSPRQAMPAQRKIPHEWIEQIQVLNPKYLIPSSCQFIFENWSWMNQVYFPISYKQFESDIASKLPQTSVIRLSPSCSVMLDSKSIVSGPSLNWMQPEGPQDLDYDYHESFQPQTTSEIAKKLNALSDVQFNLVDEFCKQGIVNIYSMLELPEESSFSNLMIWKLSTFDQSGINHHYYYEIHGQKINFLSKSQEKFDWLTEIPSSKIFAALMGGEATNSIYIRINDFENLLQNLDPLQDPLLRCLYGREFASYQKYQLKKIK